MNITKSFKNKGFRLSSYLIFKVFLNRIRSNLRILFFNFLGFKIDSSVTLEKNIELFQGKKNAIKIGEKSFIGYGVRIKAGFDGEIEIGKNVYVHDYTFIFAHSKLIIGDNTLISPNVFITDFDHKYPHSKYKNLLSSKDGYVDKTVFIGKNVWIGANSVILPGVSIGDDSVVGAGSIVTKNVPSGSIAVGNPARVVKKIYETKKR